MDDERHEGKRNWIWLLIIIAVILIWWFWRPHGTTHHVASADDAGQTVPGEILVDLADSDSDARVAEVGRIEGLTLQPVDDTGLRHRLYRAAVDPARETQVLAELAKMKDVEVAEPDSLVTLDEPSGPIEEVPATDPVWKTFPNDPEYKYQWHLDQIHMKQAWPLASGDGVVVAVIDTGVSFENYQGFHLVPDLAGVKFVKPYDFVHNNAHADDDHGHGTHVAGTIAQATNNGVGVAGIARGVSIMPLKVLGAGGSGSVAGIADAIRYAADNGAKVINMSLGGRFKSKVLENAVKYAHGKGVVVVCAAGNDGSKRVSFPAASPGAFAVAATQYDETTTFYSNYGKEIDIAAPGGNTKVDQNGDGKPDGVLQNTIEVGNPKVDGYYGFMGTSMASPHVAGVAALVVGQGVTDPDEVEKIIQETARQPKGGKMDKLKYGAGIIDAKAAVIKARSTTGGGWELGFGLLLAGALAFVARRGPTAGFVGATVMGASGLYFFPKLGFLSRGFPSWDLSFLGAAHHGNLLFFSALVPFVLSITLLSVKRLRGALAGFSVGVAAHLAFFAAAHPIQMSSAWLAANALFATALSYFTLRE
jgi:serine protease